MSSDTSLLFGCPVCGFKVTGELAECSRCGTRFSDETRFECPFCGSMVDRSSTSCPECHISYSEFTKRAEARTGGGNIDALLEEIIRIEAAEVKKGGKRFSCPVCAWMLGGSEEKCPKCGASFLKDVSFQCPICAATVDADATACSECGTTFAVEEATTPEEEAAKVSTAVSALEAVASESSPGMTTSRGLPAEAAPEVNETGPEPEEPTVSAEESVQVAEKAVAGPERAAPEAPEVSREEAKVPEAPLAKARPPRPRAAAGSKTRKLKAKPADAGAAKKPAPKPKPPEKEEKRKKKGLLGLR